MSSPEWLGRPVNNCGYKLKTKPQMLVLEGWGFCLECYDFNSEHNFAKALGHDKCHSRPGIYLNP